MFIHFYTYDIFIFFNYDKKSFIIKLHVNFFV
jgi:hypothetical protein